MPFNALLVNLERGILGVVLSTAAGFPIGREGPMVCIGGCLGIAVMHILASPQLRRWVDVGAKGRRPCLLLEEDRFRHAKRASYAYGLYMRCNHSCFSLILIK